MTYSHALGRKLNRRRQHLSPLGPIIQLGFSKASDFPGGANMLPAFVKFSPLTLGVDVRSNTGNLTFRQPVSLQSTGDRISSLLQGRSTKVPPFGKGQGTFSAETGPMDAGLLYVPRWVGIFGWGE